MDTTQLRLIASHHMGIDLRDRLDHAELTQRQQRDALRTAADRIDELEAELAQLKGETHAAPPMCS
jgi:hypothetical protein